MSHKVRINLANPAELLELPGLRPEQATAIIKFRGEHGPITDAGQLERILGGWPVSEDVPGRSTFVPPTPRPLKRPGPDQPSRKKHRPRRPARKRGRDHERTVKVSEVRLGWR
jgi:hypothetical protein